MNNRPAVKAYALVLALFLCSVLIGIVAIWGFVEQGSLVRSLSRDSENLSDRMTQFRDPLQALFGTTNEIVDSLEAVEEEAEHLDQLLSEYREQSDKQNKDDGVRLAYIGRQIVDRYLDRARFLVDTLVKSPVVRSGIEGMRNEWTRQLKRGPQRALGKISGDVEEKYRLVDTVQSLTASAAADFFAIVEIGTAQQGQVMYSDDERLQGSSLSESNIFAQVVSENRIAKGLDRFAGELILGAGSIVRDKGGKDIAVVISGFRLNKRLLRLMERELGVSVAVSQEAQSPSGGESTLNATGLIPFDESVLQKQREFIAGTRESPLDRNRDIRQLESSATQVSKLTLRDKTILAVYSPLLTDKGVHLGTIAFARDLTGDTLQKQKIDRAQGQIKDRLATLNDAKRRNVERTKDQSVALDGLLNEVGNYRRLLQSAGTAAIEKAHQMWFLSIASLTIAFITFIAVLALIKIHFITALERSFADLRAAGDRHSFFQSVSSSADHAKSLRDAFNRVLPDTLTFLEGRAALVIGDAVESDVGLIIGDSWAELKPSPAAVSDVKTRLAKDRLLWVEAAKEPQVVPAGAGDSPSTTMPEDFARGRSAHFVVSFGH